MLVHLFLDRYAPGSDIRVSSNALKSLMQYDWPGNVRELENCVERAVALGNGHIIDSSDLPPSIAADSLPGSASESAVDEALAIVPSLAAEAQAGSSHVPLSTSSNATTSVEETRLLPVILCNSAQRRRDNHAL
jgi:DNA-binding NtrC family response regulator